MSSDTPRSNHGAEVLKRAIANRHAVRDVEDVAGGPRDVEDTHTLIESLGRNPLGDLSGPTDGWSVHDSLAEIRSLRDSEDE